MTAEITDLPKIESRMLRWMTLLAVAGVVVILATGRWQTAACFAVGATLGVLNFHWMWQTGNLLMAAQTAHVPFRTAFVMVARYPLALGALALLYFSGSVPLLPVIAGLLVPGAGVLVEAMFLIGAGLSHKQTA